MTDCHERIMAPGHGVTPDAIDEKFLYWDIFLLDRALWLTVDEEHQSYR